MTPEDCTHSNEIRLTRVYDAPLARVWDAWTDPAQIGQWWGPRGFRLTTHSRDLRAGGTWVYTMHGPDGTDYPNFTKYLEVESHRRLVYDHGATSSDAKPLFRMTVEFREHGGSTTLELRMAFDNAGAARDARVFIKAAGGNGTWDRLAEHLVKQASDREIFVIHRSFAASVETLFQSWVSPEQFSRWLPPTGFAMTVHRIDPRPGGSGFYSMTDGQITLHGRMDYLDLHQPDRIEYVQYFTDARENLSRHPGAANFPAKMKIAVLLAAEGADAARATLRCEAYGETEPEENEAFVAERAGMTLGWTRSFDRLDALLEPTFAAGG